MRQNFLCNSFLAILIIAIYTYGDSTTSVSDETPGFTLYFIRHAETKANVTHNYSEANQTKFSRRGLRQIDALTEYLVSELQVTPDVIFVSPQWRTQKTIEPYLAATHQKASIWAELDECCYQDASDTMPLSVPLEEEEIQSYTPYTFVLQEQSHSHLWKTETFEAGVLMVQSLKDSLLSRFSGSGKTVFLVGHYLSGNVLLGLLQGYDMSIDFNHDNPHELWLKNSGVSKLVETKKDSAMTLIELNSNNP